MNSNMNLEVSNDMRLKGVVSIYVENTETGERKLWYEDHNTFVISGMQWVLMKMFGLHLDSSHATKYEEIGQDTTLVTPDLNTTSKLGIGVSEDRYTTMESDIPENHFIQGFMVGTGGSGEDAITTKNTDYSFINLRNPIPFQQTQIGSNVSGLDSSIAGQYLGVYRQATGSTSKSYYIKKFDGRPHIYHNWWRDGQKWDYLDPVQAADLGPDGNVAKTNRIETYAQVEMSVDVKNGDCLEYFNHGGSTDGTAMINELGLVAFDTIAGQRSIIENVYKIYVKKLIQLIFDNNRGNVDEEVIDLSKDIFTVLSAYKEMGQTNINAFIDVVETLSGGVAGEINYTTFQNELCKDTNIGVEAFYNQSGTFIYSTDNFLTYLSGAEFNNLTTDEAQRIKLVTYYTFNAIPLQKNWKILINYRIYAN